jgi:hypothetical protein
MVSIINKVENVNNNKFNFKRLRDLDSSSQKKRYKINGKYNIRHKVVEIFKTDWEQQCINKDKIIISMPGYIKALYDKDCACSDATFFMYVKNKDHGEFLIKLLNSDLYQFIINSYREITGLNNFKNINRLSIIENIDELSLSDKELELLKIVEKPEKLEKEKIEKSKNDKKYICDCGVILNKSNKVKHEQTLKHKKFIEKNEKVNKDIKKKKIIIDDDDEDENDEDDKIDYSKYTVVQLKNIAKEKGIKLKSKINKQEIINLLKI